MPEVHSALASVCPGEDSKFTVESLGIDFEEIPIGDLISISAWQDSFDLVCKEISTTLDIKIPQNYYRAEANNDHTLFMVAPRRFLAQSSYKGLGSRLASRFCGEDGVITELGHSRTRIRIRGPGTRALLARGVAINLDKSAFPAGHFAQCAIHHMWLLLHKVSDDEGEDAFDIYVLRSFAASFWHWLTSTAGLIGNEVKR